MNLRAPLFAIFFLTLSVLPAQKQITLEEIWGGAFSTEGLQVLRSMNDGQYYTVLEMDRGARRSSIVKYEYRTQQPVGTLVATDAGKGIPFFTSYAFSADESRVILATDVTPVYRRSRLGVYYVYDLGSGELVQIASEAIQEPTLSPDGSQVAYVFQNNLYVKNLASGAVSQITQDGQANAIINGVTDWVYEEEFAFVRAFAWNATGTRIAFLRFDEREVPEFSMDVYGSGLYPFPYVFKYPKAGEANASVSLHMHDLQAGTTRPVDLGNPYYIPRIQWMQDANHLSVQTLNRHQNRLQLLQVDAGSLETTLLLEETDAAYVDVTDNLTFLPGDRFIWTSEKDGYNHIYLHAADGSLERQLTSGPWEVTAYYGFDAKRKRIYYQSAEQGSTLRDVYSVGVSGKGKRRLTEGAGTHRAAFSTDFSYFIDTYSSVDTPPVYTLHRASDGKAVKELKNNQALLDKLAGYQISPKEFSTLRVNGNDLNMYMIKPADFDPAKEYPLLMFQYSGPGSQQVANSWFGSNDYWHQMLASEGYIIACVDGRGTGLKGRDFKKVTQLELGKYEVEDQIEAARILSERPYIDASRTGIWGWSYGGFMSSNCILKGNEVFEVAIAVAPVTSWRFYDTIYTERYMHTPQENPEGYDQNSPLFFADQLKGSYLLVHGSADDNVHVQNTMRMVEALVQANRPFEWAIYPDKNHGIYGGNTRLHLYNKMTDFIRKNL
ncbi:S9 family peptidase [Robiginitalea sp. M366]|uniref:S9 family peptidase n=1 Tax=Robiginitalea aestuariiviva TaxID=3036903 RepID=UPI00240D0CCA|nr:S9 family peptidase [Robiginitalea aestuariiviva]MDG1571876.1 S9 family peptidase [Robiginitalea aestuariiviva]